MITRKLENYDKRVVKNDYNQHFVDTGERPQNFVRDSAPLKRFMDYPRLEKLIQLKDECNRSRAHPSQHMKVDLETFDLTSLNCTFDVVLIDPPWEEYSVRAAGAGGEELIPWSLEEMMNLKVDAITAAPSFCFLWAGSDHWDDARKLLSHWGFRRCEEICWCKTNLKAAQLQREGIQKIHPQPITKESAVFQRTKEHCLVGLKGSLKRSVDTQIVHANVDTDVILEEDMGDPTETGKPKELYEIIERFCLGRRKLELFGTDRNIRRGWLTLGKSITRNEFDRRKYLSWFEGDACWPALKDFYGGKFVGTSADIESLRPKSPPRSSKEKTPSEREVEKRPRYPEEQPLKVFQN
eukprot:GHVP01013567.1.p1 GENE.GHVP01013567.1~~GHVP01013567.1.p1  ORF type:complete len:353 (-),score=71.04 GHVP01013567.1:1400-2458(-)